MCSEECRQLPEKCDVVGEDLSNARPLHFHHDFAAVTELSRVHLSE